MASKKSIAIKQAQKDAAVNDRLTKLEKDVASLKRKVTKLEKQLKEAE